MKIKFKLIFTIMATIMLFVATEVMAGEVPVQMSCVLATDCGFECWNDSPYTFTFMGQTADPNFPGKYLWTYSISSTFPSPQNQLSILTPVCDPDIGVLPVGGGQMVMPGEGESTTGFGVGNFQDWVARVATSYPYIYQIRANVPTPLRNTSMQIKSGKTLYFCKNIAGPACAEASYVPISLYSEEQLGNIVLCIQKDPTTGCPTSITNCTDINNPQELPLFSLSGVEIQGGHLKWTGSESDSRCKSVIFYTESTPCTTKCYSTNQCVSTPACCAYTCPQPGQDPTLTEVYTYTQFGKVKCGCRAPTSP